MSGPTPMQQAILLNQTISIQTYLTQLDTAISLLPPSVPVTRIPLVGSDSFIALKSNPSRDSWQHLQPLLETVWGRSGAVVSSHVTRGNEGVQVISSLFNQVGAGSLAALEDEDRDSAIGWIRAFRDAVRERCHMPANIIVPVATPSSPPPAPVLPSSGSGSWAPPPPKGKLPLPPGSKRAAKARPRSSVVPAGRSNAVASSSINHTPSTTVRLLASTSSAPSFSNSPKRPRSNSESSLSSLSGEEEEEVDELEEQKPTVVKAVPSSSSSLKPLSSSSLGGTKIRLVSGPISAPPTASSSAMARPLSAPVPTPPKVKVKAKPKKPQTTLRSAVIIRPPKPATARPSNPNRPQRSRRAPAHADSSPPPSSGFGIRGGGEDDELDGEGEGDGGGDRFRPGTAVMARFPNYHYWPSIVLDPRNEGDLPEGVVPQGTWERGSYLVKAIPTGGDWRWNPPSLVRLLTSSETDAILNGTQRGPDPGDPSAPPPSCWNKYRADLVEGLLIAQDQERLKEWRGTKTSTELRLEEERRRRREGR
ncbi:hypothetical protein T439DRAFT_68587 [Meredithblackwellia eburnea MCA 4105]